MNTQSFVKISAVLMSIIVWTLTLTSCTHQIPSYPSHRDGPPNFRVDVNQIPDAVPKPEAKSRYGNPKSYVVRGKRYYVMPHSHGYHAKGVASWYGMQFHQHKTSSGERYDLTAMTAAHRSLPLPTYLRVTNLKNQKHVIVKVNDRGPFYSSRLIDLSYAAAKKLGIVGTGTGMVEIEAIEPDNFQKYNPYNPSRYKPTPLFAANSNSPSTYRSNAAPVHSIEQSIATQSTTMATADSKWFLQAGTFSWFTNASSYARKLKDLISYPVFIEKVRQASQTLYQVHIGPFSNQDKLEEIRSRLKMSGVQVFPRTA